MTYSVSAIIPTIGRSGLARAVRSVAEQSHFTTPIVVVAAPEAASAVTDLLRNDCLEAQVIVSDASLNGSAARNLGVNRADTDIVAFLDDDDWWMPTKVEQQLRALSAAPDRHVVSTCAAILKRNEFDTEGRVVPAIPYRAGRAADYLLARPRALYGHHFMQTSCLMGWRETFMVTPWDGNLSKHQDWDLFIRLFDAARVRHAFVPEPLAVVEGGSQDSVSRTPKWQSSLQWLKTIDVGARASNDFVLAVSGRAAIEARSRAGIVANLKALRAGFPHFGAAAALAKEVLTAGLPLLRRNTLR